MKTVMITFKRPDGSPMDAPWIVHRIVWTQYRKAGAYVFRVAGSGQDDNYSPAKTIRIPHENIWMIQECGEEGYQTDSPQVPVKPLEPPEPGSENPIQRGPV